MNYIGSKYSLIDFLQESIADVTGYKNGDDYIFADLFAGTGIVGATFKKAGCTVISNDIQHYSYILNKHFIENNEVESNDYDKYFNSIEPIDGYIYNNYCAGSGSGRNYFSDINGRKCDAIRLQIEDLKQNGSISDNQYYWFLASLINSIDKYANTASVYGAFLKHIKKTAARGFVFELLPVVYGKKGKVYNEDINTVIRKVKGDVLYLDPPYNARQYCANYHVLETISRYDNPVLRGKTGLREYNGQKSVYCSKRMVEKAFDDLISSANFKYIFLSYNNEGLMSLDAIKSIMERYGQYEIFTKDYHRFRADKEENRRHKASSTIEYLHCIVK